MINYFAAALDIQRGRYTEHFNGLPMLESYFAIITANEEDKMASYEIFLDSGAYSAFSRGISINIDDYISFIKKYEDKLTVYANLDVIGDPEATYENQKYMESKGLMPLPCFHYGESIKWLKRYLEDGHDYLALGGMVPISTKDLMHWLDGVWSDHLTDKKGMPIVKVHGFGMTSHKLLIRYPWYSVDSTSWLMGSRNGSVVIPAINEDGSREYIRRSPFSVRISEPEESIKKGTLDKSMDFNMLSGFYKGVVVDYLESVGLTKEEVSTDYKKRDKACIQYYLDLVKALPEWPWAMKKKTTLGFDFGY